MDAILKKPIPSCRNDRFNRSNLPLLKHHSRHNNIRLSRIGDNDFREGRASSCIVDANIMVNFQSLRTNVSPNIHGIVVLGIGEITAR